MTEPYDDAFWSDVRQRAERIRSLPVHLLDPVVLAAMPTIREAMRQHGIVPGGEAPAEAPAGPPPRPWKRQGGPFRQRRRA